MYPDPTSCAEEPIQIPGAIQPYGFLLVLAERGLWLEQVSGNCAELFERAPEDLIGNPLASLLGPTEIDRIEHALIASDLRSVNPLPLNIAGHTFHGVLHRRDASVILELEPSENTADLSFFRLYHAARDCVQIKHSDIGLNESCRLVAEQVTQITGFDRVLIYRFDESWNGEVIAEVKQREMDGYLGLHFPASDIPAQARKLYELNWIRLIADVDYIPSRLVPALNPVSQKPLDLGLANLRSVSPFHLEYLRNMKIAASMSISVLKDGKLWGLISCHHRQPKYVPYPVRSVCEFIGQLLSFQISAIEGKEDYARRLALKAKHSEVVRHMEAYGLVAGLTEHTPSMADAIDASGAALCIQGEIYTVGVTPDKSQIADLVAWLREEMSDGMFTCHNLAKVYSKGADIKDKASGLLALAIGRTPGSYLLWFRGEVISTINWAGNPTKSVFEDAGALRLHPRRSFDLWKETVRRTSAPWLVAEIDAAGDLKNSVVVEELARINVDLARSNEELDAFAFIASHDLKEPLRGIRNYVSFVAEDNADCLDADSKAKLSTVEALTGRMGNLLSSLYHYSRVGRVGLSLATTDLSEVLSEVLLRLEPLLTEKRIEVALEKPLPLLKCDRIRIGEVFYNLIANAAKYNDKERKTVDIGFEPTKGAFFVRDNGIGIPEKHKDNVFKIFKRLHAKDAFGGGTGTGLTIAKRIVEMHDGRIWFDSAPNIGTTFYFTLER